MHGAKNAFFAPLYAKNSDHFTKTGSGQTQGKLRQKDALCRLPPTVDATRAGAALASVLQEDPPTVRVSAHGGNFGLGLEWV